MPSVALLGVIGVAQVLICAVIVVLLIVHRRFAVRTERERQRVRDQLAEPLRAWAVGSLPTEALLPLLRTVAPVVALEALGVHSVIRAQPAERPRLAALLRREPWVQQLLDGHRSRRWAERRRAARMLVIAGESADRPLLMALLQDPHAAVVSAALSAVRTMANDRVIALILDTLPARAEFLRARSIQALREAGALTRTPLLERLNTTHDPAQLQLWLEVADLLADPCTVVACTRHAAHVDSGVRRAVARVCQHYFSERVHPALAALARDAAHDVRAEAARSLGAIRAVSCVPLLNRGLCDASHAVRLASALALTHLGPAGRGALRAAESSSDRFALDMACLVNALSPGAIRELVEV